MERTRKSVMEKQTDEQMNRQTDEGHFYYPPSPSRRGINKFCELLSLNNMLQKVYKNI